MKIQEKKGVFTITLDKNLVLSNKWKKGTVLAQMLNERGNIELVEVK